jgi:4-alpha-glucanotransferase
LPGEFGIGEIGDAAMRFVDALSEMKLRIWQFLPLGPTGFGDSPYQSLSSYAGNELLIDVAELVKNGLVTRRDTAALAALPRNTVDFGALIPHKIALLHKAAARFDSTGNAALKARFDAFIETSDAEWLHDYALFRVLKSHHGGGSWMTWPTKFRHRELPALRHFAATHAGKIGDVKIMQFLFHDQWQRLRRHARERGILLFGDLPIYIPWDSADAWQSGDILQLDADGRPDGVAGVPPDYFSETGQLWGNPLYDWQRQAANGFQWWIARLGRAMQLADIVRIDHFRGFEAYWAVPADSATAATGRWVQGPGDALFDALEQALGPLPVVAEDLGEITPAVHALRRRHGLPGMRVLQFEVAEPGFALTDIPAECVCYTGTHDNDTVRGWFDAAGKSKRRGTRSSDFQKRVLTACNGKATTVHDDMIRLAFASAARVAIAPLQDFLGLQSEARLNTPGTTTGNWRWRTRGSALDAAFRDKVLCQVESSGRGL